jgi:hypothetical protein
MGSWVIVQSQYGILGLSVPHPVKGTVTHPGEFGEEFVYVA